MRVLVIGGGAAGMMAAAMAAREGAEVTLLEKNEKLGKKIFITGKGRCNLTNAADPETCLMNIVSNRKFMYSSLYGFTSADTVEYFNALGLKTKVERGNRVFPISDKAYDVTDALKREMRRLSVRIHLNTEVKELLTEEGEEGAVCRGAATASGQKFTADRVIVATGGLSYPSTGSTGDGCRFARSAGHKTVEPVPSLVPLEVREPWVRDLMGLSLKNTAIRVTVGKKELCRDFGEMLFTHFGVSGPIILSASAVIPAKYLKKDAEPRPVLHLDLKPALSKEQLTSRLIREFEENRGKQFKNGLDRLFPSRLIPVMVSLSGIDPLKKCGEITREEREGFLNLIRDLPLTLTSTRGFEEAVITKGGVSVREINPATMESKLVKGLYFAGEVLDVDALTGGFNLQIAWSTGAAAGRSAAETG